MERPLFPSSTHRLYLCASARAAMGQEQSALPRKKDKGRRASVGSSSPLEPTFDWSARLGLLFVQTTHRAPVTVGYHTIAHTLTRTAHHITHLHTQAGVLPDSSRAGGGAKAM